MAYYNGQASSYQELLDVLVAACVAEGWVWADQILRKNGNFIHVFVSTASGYVSDEGICLQAGTGVTSGNLENASAARPRMGRSNSTTTPSFPVDYHIHIHENPNEVYFYVKHDIDKYIWLAFGESTISDAKTWICANWSFARNQRESIQPDLYQLTHNSGGSTSNSSSNNSSRSPGMLFWDSSPGVAQVNTNTILFKNEFVDCPVAMQTQVPLLSRLPSLFNAESVLLPIQPHLIIASSKAILVAELKHAKYLRIDNYEPEQILHLGDEKWKVYPGHRKSLINKDGGSAISHTGTFGHAIRYDGP